MKMTVENKLIAELKTLSTEQAEIFLDNLKRGNEELYFLLVKKLKEASEKVGMMYKPHKKQALFHKLGKTATQRMFMAGNRCGKTYSACMEVSYHLTGDYPEWWEGKVFDEPTNIVTATQTVEMARNILQRQYIGDIKYLNSENGGVYKGTIPKNRIEDIVKKRNAGDSIDVLSVGHVSGGVSQLIFKSYDQGREKFQGTSNHFIHLDEEPTDYDLYKEALMRIMDKGGSLILTMTPLFGVTSLVEQFSKHGLDTEKVIDGKALVRASWEDNKENLPKNTLIELERSFKHDKNYESRRSGVPTIGTGKVYQFTREEVEVKRFAIPKHYEQFFSIDFGWSPDPTAVLFFARDPDTDVIYVTKEYKVGESTPKQHATALEPLTQGWIRGVCDPYGGSGSNQVDGKKMVDRYNEEGLKLELAERNEKNYGVSMVLEMFMSGRLKIFSDLEMFFSEFNKYYYNAKGKLPDKDDHLMDCLRYGVVSGKNVAKTEQRAKMFGSFRNFIKRNSSSWESV